MFPSGNCAGQCEAFGAGFDPRYVPTTQVGCEKLFAAKRTVRWMAQGVCYGVLDKEMYLSFRTHPVYTRGFVAGNVQVPAVSNARPSGTRSSSSTHSSPSCGLPFWSMGMRI